MKAVALRAWRRLRPEGGHPVYLAASLARLGCAQVACALRAAQTVLDRQGWLPARTRDSEVFVREDVCPDTKNAVIVARKTAFCARMDRRCVRLLEVSDDAVRCAALRTGGIADLLPTQITNIADQLKPGERHMLFVALGLIAPSVIKRMKQWLRDRRYRKDAAKRVTVARMLAQRMIRERGLPFQLDSVTGLFVLRDRRFSIRKDGVVCVGPAGAHERFVLEVLPERLPVWLDAGRG